MEETSGNSGGASIAVRRADAIRYLPGACRVQASLRATAARPTKAAS
jgi:hypothetical protein